jgi:hypothetical protein
LEIDRFSISHNFSRSFLACVGKTTEIRSLSLMPCNLLEAIVPPRPCRASTVSFMFAPNAYFVLFLWVMSEASASTDQVSALALAPFSNGDSSIMKYEGYLKPWAVARLLAMGDRRSLSQPDAEGHLQLFRQRVPNIRFEVVFDLPSRRG